MSSIKPIDGSARLPEVWIAPRARLRRVLRCKRYSERTILNYRGEEEFRRYVY